MQLEYSLVERNIEREHVPAAQELGIGICPWSPLAGGFLAGKYKRDGDSGTGEGRLEVTKSNDNPAFQKFSDRNWRIHDALVEVSKQLGRKPALVALNWAATQPGITSTIIGATKLPQLEDNLASLEFDIPAELRARLDETSALENAHPYIFFTGKLQEMIAGGTKIHAWQPANVYGPKPDTKRASAAK